jgi:cytochrome c553
MRRFVLVIALFSACGKGDQPPPPTSGTPGAKPESGPGQGAMGGGAPTAPAAGGPGAEARQLFATVCATCHGADGSGNGPAAASIQPKPRNYTDPAWQASVTDDDIKKIILEGGQALGKSPMMPAQIQLRDKPEVLAELVKLIRGFSLPR